KVDVDYFRIRRSTNTGASFGPEYTAATIYDNFGTGAPGFNRIRGIAFPSVAVDRTTGINRGRLYLTWNESLNWYDDLENVGSLGDLSEVENNNSPASATVFQIGRRSEERRAGKGRTTA